MAMNEKIENLNLIALRNYACPKVNSSPDWFWKCMECAGIEDCKVGRRVRDIIEDQTAPDKKKELYAQLDAMMAANRPKKDETKKYVEALKSDDPVGYLVAFYKNRTHAREMLIKWMDRNGIKYDVPYNGRAYKEEAQVKHGHRQARLIAVFGDAKTPKEMLERYRQTYGRDIPSTTAYGWLRSYPDLGERYPLRQLARVLESEKRNRMDIPAKKDEDTKEDDDEVSVEDFLNEQENTTEEVAVEEPVVEMPEEEKKEDPNDILRAEFVKKRIELEGRIESLKALINDLCGQMDATEQEIISLEKTAKIFGFILVNTRKEEHNDGAE